MSAPVAHRTTAPQFVTKGNATGWTIYGRKSGRKMPVNQVPYSAKTRVVMDDSTISGRDVVLSACEFAYLTDLGYDRVLFSAFHEGTFHVQGVCGTVLNYAVVTSTPDDVGEFDYLYALSPEDLKRERARILATTPAVTPGMRAIMDRHDELIRKSEEGAA